MMKVKNIAEGIYADGELFVHPGEVIEVSEGKAAHLLASDTAGKFEVVVDGLEGVPVIVNNVIVGVEVSAEKPKGKAK